MTTDCSPVKLKIHTLLDGTPVLVRWLEITNTSEARGARKSSWAGRCGPWMTTRNSCQRPENIFTLGYYTSSYWSWEVVRPDASRYYDVR